MKDLTATDILTFCSTERSRSYLSTPFVIGDGGFTYATNGHLAVRIPGRHVDIDQMANVSSIVGMFESVEDIEYRPFDLVTDDGPKLSRCGDCSGHSYIIKCATCDGHGSHECSDARCRCEHDCGSCDGLGVFPARASDPGANRCETCDGTGLEIDRRGVDLGSGLAVQWRYLQKVQSMPGPLSWGVPVPTIDKSNPKQRNYGPIAFMGCGWMALIMPRRTYGDEAIVAIRHELEVAP